MTEPVYKPLIAGVTSLVLGAKLYRTEEFLLIATGAGFSESYRRVYFRDIQSIQMMPTRSQFTGAVISGVLALVLLGLAALSLTANDVEIVIIMGLLMGIPCVFCIVWFIINLAAGPTCQCVVHTAVQSVRLNPVNRMAQYGRIIAEIGPLIEAAQGRMESDELHAKLTEAWDEMTRNAPTGPVTPAARRPRRFKPSRRLQARLSPAGGPRRATRANRSGATPDAAAAAETEAPDADAGGPLDAGEGS